MHIVNYFESIRQEELLKQIEQADWGAARFLVQLIREGTFAETLGGWGEVYLLMDGDKAVSFATLSAQDCIRDESMIPWIGFVFTYPEYRGQHMAGQLLDHIAEVAARRGYPKVYVATDHVGVYEKYGFAYLKNQVSVWGDDDRVLVRELSDLRPPLRIETQRLVITEFTRDMAEAVHLNSLDEDTRQYLPDEVFETPEEAADTIDFLRSCYESGEGPLVYPVLTREGANVGYVQAVPLDEGGWEIGYHIGGKYTGNGYATEAVRAFLPVIMNRLGIAGLDGICLTANVPSCRVLEKCGFRLEFDGMGSYQGQEKPIRKYSFHL